MMTHIGDRFRDLGKAPRAASDCAKLHARPASEFDVKVLVRLAPEGSLDDQGIPNAFRMHKRQSVPMAQPLHL